MYNFIFSNPVKILFGKGMISELPKEIHASNRILIIYGGGSIKQNGVYSQVIDALKQRSVFEFGGIEANPHYETCCKVVNYIHQNQITFLLAVGGGSVIDATKFIAASAKYNGDAWDLMVGKSAINDALPFGTVLTLPAAGSEMNTGFVITKNSTQEKFAMSSHLTAPKFSILDPETTYSLPPRQTVNGIIDTFVHVTEQYITYNQKAKVQDYFAEALLKVLIEEGPKALQFPADYNIRANLMWASTWALNNWISQGVDTDWATHMIGHELTALYGLDHGQTLAIVLPGVLEVKRDNKEEKLLQLGKNVFGINNGNIEHRIDQTIKSIENFFISLGVKTHISEYNISNMGIDKIVNRFKERNWFLGEKEDIDYNIVRKILHLRY